MIDRISSLDSGYVTGDLSVFPAAIDSLDELYEVSNNAESVLTNALSYNSDFILIEDTSNFPDKGIICIGNELIYYNEKSTGILKNLKRGFANSKQQHHYKGATVKHGVSAEPHNACKDAIYNIQHYLGTSEVPEEGTFSYKLDEYENKILAPKPSFRAYPRSGAGPLKVRFQNFTNKASSKFLWDFGDGSYSTDDSPTHTYLTEGSFSVELRVITYLGGGGTIKKNDYIIVENTKGIGFFYVTPEIGTTSTTFTFIDQTDGDIIQRHWNFGDGEKITIDDPDVHTVTYSYDMAGTYDPNLLVVFSDQSIRRVNLADSIIVS